MIEIRQALLDSEFNSVKDFLAGHDLILDKDVDTTLYLIEDNKIIGTISKSSYIIKDVAVDPSYQGSDLTGMLVNKMMEKMAEENIHNYILFTKNKYEMIFNSLGFKTLVKSESAVMMEKGKESIDDIINNNINLVQNNFLMKIDDNSDIGCSVINANPFTLGHQYLVETISKNHDYCIVFLVSEDKSIFTYKERLAMAYLATRRFNNVIILPSSRYMVSLATFPTYFIHSIDEQSKNAATLDAKIFKDYFMKRMHICKRYVGTESKDYMKLYNLTLKELLGNSIVELDRIVENDNIVSASKVRSLLEEHNYIEARKYIPNESKLIFDNLVKEKYES